MCVCVCVAKPVAVELRCHATALIRLGITVYFLCFVVFCVLFFFAGHGTSVRMVSTWHTSSS